MKKSGKCFLCLKDNHQVKNCKKFKPCYYCKGLHNSALCFQKDKKGDSSKLTEEFKQDKKTNFSFVMLQTAVVIVKNPKDSKELKIKALFDNGSQGSYISNRVANFLNLPSESVENICISTFGNNQPSNQKANVVTVQLKSKVEESIGLKVLSVAFICMPLKIQPIEITQREFENLREINFADTGKHYDIDLLIGSDSYWKSFTGETLKGKNNTVATSESKFGWVLNGTVEKKTK